MEEARRGDDGGCARHIARRGRRLLYADEAVSSVDEPVLDRALVAPQRDRVSRPVEVYGDDLMETIAAHPADEQLAQKLLKAAR